MILENFVPFEGQHCETTATGSLLKSIGIELSEPLLFGLGEGLGFIFWNMKQMDFPFIGGRNKAGDTGNEGFINQASAILMDLSGKEKRAMESLEGI